VRYRVILLLMASLMAILFGCGPKPSGGNGSGGSAIPTVRLGFFPNVTHAAALIGTADGSFAKSLGSAKLEEQIYNAGPAEIEALFADQIDIGYIGPGPAVNGFFKSRGKALRIVAGASDGGAGLVVRADSGITSVAGLAGKRVAVPQTGGTQDIALRHALRGAGLQSTDKGGSVTVLPTANPDALTLFVKKELDAAWVPEPWVSRLVKEGNGKLILDERDLWPNKSFATTVIIVREKFLAEQPELVERFLAAHVEAVQWIADHPDEARKRIGERIETLTHKALPEDVLRTSLERTRVTYDPLRETILATADAAKELGYQREGREGLGSLIDLKPLNAALAKAKLPAVQ
jgi:NitT/TauT family transport system substrate-binding protein